MWYTGFNPVEFDGVKGEYMRMWMVPPHLLCDKHLLGEHFELHKFRHCFVKKQNMNKRVALGQIDHTKLKERHDELVIEMLTRGIIHNSKFVECDVSFIIETPTVNIKSNLEELCARCKKCKEKIGDKK